MPINGKSNQETDYPINLPDTKQVFMALDLPQEITTQFISSTESALENLESAALELESRPDNPESLQEAKRIVHTIKGETGFLGLPEIAEACHEIETCLEKLLKANQSPTDFLLRVKDWLAAFIHNLSQNMAGAPTVKKEKETPVATDHKNEPRFLVVEDTPVSRMLLECFLSEHGECVTAANGREGLEKFVYALDTNQPFDMLCLDIMMPEMSGQELLVEIRKVEAERGILGLDGARVIMTTALGDAKNVLGAFRTGCEAYLVKPVAKDKLINEIRRMGIIE